MKIGEIITPMYQIGPETDAHRRKTNSEEIAPSGVDVAHLMQHITDGIGLKCSLLAQDELDLISVVMRQCDISKPYQPSMTLLNAIRSLNAKLALCRAQSRTESAKQCKGVGDAE